MAEEVDYRPGPIEMLVPARFQPWPMPTAPDLELMDLKVQLDRIELKLDEFMLAMRAGALGKWPPK